MKPHEPRYASGHRSTLSATDAQRLLEWHERAWEDLRGKPERVVTAMGLELEVPAEVFPPTPMSDLLGSAVLSEVRQEDRVLDMGTGCGINALLAASTAWEVIGVDVNPHAVVAARANAVRNGLSENTEFFESDVFDQVEGSFDLVVFDPPFRWLKPREMLERSMTDEAYEALTRFMRELPSRLRPGGRALLFFGTSGDMQHFRQVMDDVGLSEEVLASRTLTRDGMAVEYFAFRVTCST